MTSCQVNLSCFSTERKHKSSKGVAGFAFRHWCKTMLRRDLDGLMHYLEQAHNFKPYYLESVTSIGEQATRPGHARHQAAAAMASVFPELIALGLQLEGKGLHTPVGMVYRGDDVLAFLSPGGALSVGFLKQCLQHQDGSYWCYLLVLECMGGACYSKANANDTLIMATAIVAALPYFCLDDRVFVLAPPDLGPMP